MADLSGSICDAYIYGGLLLMVIVLLSMWGKNGRKR